MKIDLSRSELLATLASLKYLENRYERGAVPSEYLREANQDMEQAVNKALSDVRGVIGKIEATVCNGGGFIFLYLPDGIRDKKLMRELGERIPKRSDWYKDNFFWSNKFKNLAIREKFAEEAIRAIQARYGDNVRIVKNPEWTSKDNVWQIVKKRAWNGGKSPFISHAR